MLSVLNRLAITYEYLTLWSIEDRKESQPKTHPHRLSRWTYKSNPRSWLGRDEEYLAAREGRGDGTACDSEAIYKCVECAELKVVCLVKKSQLGGDPYVQS